MLADRVDGRRPAPRRLPSSHGLPSRAPRTRPPPGSGAAGGRRSGARRRPARVPGRAAAGRGARPRPPVPAVLRELVAGLRGLGPAEQRLLELGVRPRQAGRRRVRAKRSSRSAIRSCSSCARSVELPAPATARRAFVAPVDRGQHAVADAPASAPPAGPGRAAVPARRPPARGTRPPRSAPKFSQRRNRPRSGTQPPACSTSSCSRTPSAPTSTNRENAPTSTSSSAGSSDSTAVTRCSPVSELRHAARSSPVDIATSGWLRWASTTSSRFTAAAGSKVTGRCCGTRSAVSSFSASPAVARCHEPVSGGTSNSRSSTCRSLSCGRSGRCRASSRAVSTTRRTAAGVMPSSATVVSSCSRSRRTCRGTSVSTGSVRTGCRRRPPRRPADLLADHPPLHGVGEHRVHRAEVGAHRDDLAGHPGEELQVRLEGVDGVAPARADEVADVGCVLLAVAVDAADALLQPVRVERDVVVDQAVAVALQVDALAGGVGGEQDADRVLGRVGLERQPQLLALVGGHAAVQLRDVRVVHSPAGAAARRASAGCRGTR